MITAIVFAVALTADQVGICADMGELAATTMEIRQLGGPRSLFEAAIRDNGTDMPLFSNMIEQAYAESRWFTEASRTRTIEDFRDKWENVCFGMFKELSQ